MLCNCKHHQRSACLGTPTGVFCTILIKSCHAGALIGDAGSVGPCLFGDLHETVQVMGFHID